MQKATKAKKATKVTKDLEKGLKIVVNKRLKGFYRDAFKKARFVAQEARRRRDLKMEIQALWEVIDAGKIIYPEKKNLLRQAGLRALKLSRQRGDTLSQAEASVRWGALCRTLGRHAEAVEILAACLSLRDSPLRGQSLDPQLRAYALWNLAFALRACLKLKDSRRRFLKAKGIFARLRDSSGVAYSLCGLAGVTRLLGDPSKSLSFYRQALRLFKKDRDPYGTAYANCGMGNALRKQGDFKKAIAHYNLSQKLYRRLGDQINEGYVLWGRAQCWRSLGDLKKAISDIARAKRYFRKSHDQRGLALLSVFFKRRYLRLDKIVSREAQLS